MQGYHPFAEDAEIYLPGVERILHPELFPVGREFFLVARQLTLFPNLIAFSLRSNSLADGSRLVALARGIDFSAAAGMLGVVAAVLFECESTVVRSVSGSRAAVDSGRGDRAVHHGPVSESAESGGIRGSLHAGANTGEEVCAGVCCGWYLLPACIR